MVKIIVQIIVSAYNKPKRPAIQTETDIQTDGRTGRHTNRQYFTRQKLFVSKMCDENIIINFEF